MLILTRKSGEAVCIGRAIKVRILEIRGDRVRLGIEADRAIPVVREEIAGRYPAWAQAAEEEHDPA